MNNFIKLKPKLEELINKFGDKYFILIAPFDLKECENLKIFDYYVYNRIQPPNYILTNQKKLDIYFVEHKYIGGMNSSIPVIFSRLSDTDLKEL